MTIVMVVTDPSRINSCASRRCGDGLKRYRRPCHNIGNHGLGQGIVQVIRDIQPKIAGDPLSRALEPCGPDITGKKASSPALPMLQRPAETVLSKAMRLPYSHPAFVCGAWEQRQAHAARMAALYR